MHKHVILPDDTGVNFREIRLGAIAPGVLYRSSHPAPNGVPDREVIRRACRARINCVINLHDGMTGLRKSAAASVWYKGLFSQGRVIGLNFDFDFASRDFNPKAGQAINFMLEHEGPYLIHCFAGVDRIGFFSALLEAFMGATIQEIAGDYRHSFVLGAPSALFNGGVSSAGAEILRQLAVINKGEPLTNDTVQAAAERYLSEGVGLGAEKTEALKQVLAGWSPGEGRI